MRSLRWILMFVVCQVVLPLCGSPCYAANDGNTGATSVATVDVSIEIPKLIVVSGFSDFSFGAYSGTGNLEGSDDVTVSMNVPSGSGLYQVTAECTASNSPSNVCNVSDGQNLIPFSLFFNDQPAPSGARPLIPGIPLQNLTGANFPLDNLNISANIRVLFNETDLQRARAGHYHAQVSMQFAAQ